MKFYIRHNNLFGKLSDMEQTEVAENSLTSIQKSLKCLMFWKEHKKRNLK